MRRRDLLSHLHEHGCRFVREGSEHSIWENPELSDPDADHEEPIYLLITAASRVAQIPQDAIT